MPPCLRLLRPRICLVMRQASAKRLTMFWINLGLRKMAEATTTHGFWELMRIARWHVEGDAFDRVLAIVVEAQAALPMAAFWGTGRTASSDGQFFPSAGR